MILDMAQPSEHTRLVPLEDHYTTDEAAEKLGIKRTGVLKLIERKKLKGERVGSQWFIHKDEIARYQRERKSPGRPKVKRPYVRKTGD